MDLCNNDDCSDETLNRVEVRNYSTVESPSLTV